VQPNQARKSDESATGSLDPVESWSRDVRVRIRPGRPDSGVKLYVTDHGPDGPRELMANTRFFRYPQLFDVLIDLLMAMPANRPMRVCIVPLSVGLEAISFVIAGLRKGLFDRRETVVEGFDLSRKATELARGGVYPRHFFPPDLEPLREFVREREDGFIEVRANVTRHIEVLPADDALRPRHHRTYDLVVCLNLLMHVAEADRTRLVDSLAAMTAPGGLLVINNNQEWPEELAPFHQRLSGKGFESLHRQIGTAGEPDFAVTDARAMILRREI
jgi:chemotaxis methyl-accepting protein methylase